MLSIAQKSCEIDFYRLIDRIDNVYAIDIDSHRFIERFSDIDFYRLPTSGLYHNHYSLEFAAFHSGLSRQLSKLLNFSFPLINLFLTFAVFAKTRSRQYREIQNTGCTPKRLKLSVH